MELLVRANTNGDMADCHLWFMINGSWLMAIYGSWFKVNGSWFVALMIGCGISVTIEALQFLLKRGFSEVDDVMHNTVGCLIGWCMVKGSRLMTC